MMPQNKSGTLHQQLIIPTTQVLPMPFHLGLSQALSIIGSPMPTQTSRAYMIPILAMKMKYISMACMVLALSLISELYDPFLDVTGFPVCPGHFHSQNIMIVRSDTSLYHSHHQLGIFWSFPNIFFHTIPPLHS
jgi:hypothetical protein